MPTTTEILSVNGVVLNQLAKNIESLTGRLRTPAKRTDNVRVAGRHGAVRVRGKRYDTNVIALPMWVVGCEDDGSIPTGTNARRLFQRNVDQLAELFTQGEELDIRWTKPDGSIRQCFGEVLDSIDFSTQGASPMAKFGVSIEMADPFWQDLTAVTSTKTANTTSVTLTEFAGATAPMEDLTLTLTGPWTNPVLTFSDDSWLAYDFAIPGGQSVVINCANWSLSGVGGLTPDLSKLRYKNDGARWASVPATNRAAPVIRTAGSSRTTSTRLVVSGRRKYLVG